MQPYSSPFWLTFKQAIDAKGSIKKGEHGSQVVFWKKVEYVDKHILPITGQANEDEGEVKTGLVLRYYTVFNLEQTEGIKMPEVVKNTISPIAVAEAIVKGYPEQPEMRFEEARAYYRPGEDYINLPKRETFITSEEFYSTLFHEMTHSTGHEKRLNRFSDVNYNHMFGSSDYSKEELIAEMGSAFLCGKAGILQPVIVNQEAYIQGWLKALKGDASLVISAGGKAQKAYDHILNIQA